MNARTNRLLTLHALHVGVPLVVMFSAQSEPMRIVGAVGIFLGAFSLYHDAAHGALGLPRMVNEVLISASAMLLGVSGHAARRAHMHHHSKPFVDDDLEGGAVDRPWRYVVRFCLTAPYALVRTGWARAPKERVWQAIEWLSVLALLVACANTQAAKWYPAIVVPMQLTAPVWAGIVPHRAPRWLLQLAAVFAKWRVALAVQLIAHDEHHEHPKRACFELAAEERGAPPAWPLEGSQGAVRAPSKAARLRSLAVATAT